MALKLGKQTYQILANDDEVCIPSISSILLAVVRHLVAKNLFILSILLRKSLSLLSGSLEGTEKHKKKGHASFSLHKDDFPLVRIAAPCNIHSIREGCFNKDFKNKLKLQGTLALCDFCDWEKFQIFG